MSKIDKSFKKIVKETLKNGDEYTNKRRNITRLQIPSYTFRHDMINDGFPLLSLKETPIKSVIAELIWFLRGDNTKEGLNKLGTKIWDKDIANWNGIDAGKNYSINWRNYAGQVDQIQNLINDMQKDIFGSRLKVEAWNPAELDKTALPPCHTGFQIIGCKNGFELHWNQRSCDLFLGIPYNIASYATLGLILEHITGYKFLALQGDLKCVHLYGNSISESLLLISRKTNVHPNCSIKLNLPEYKGDFDEFINDVTPEDFKLINYSSFNKIKVEMLAPIKNETK